MTKHITGDDQGLDSSQPLNCLPWADQIAFILEAEFDGADIKQLSDLKHSYSRVNKRLYDTDLNRYNYLFLSSANIAQTIHLYEGLNDTAQYNLIAAITSDHPHLHEMIEIHEAVKQTCSITSVFTPPTIQ